MSKPQRLGAASVAALTIGVVVYQFGFRNPASAPVSTGPAASSIAVLYFDDLSDDGELGYVADGITEGMIRQLSRVQGLDVVSRNGVAPYRGTDVTPDSIGRALEVGSVIRGSVEPEGDAIRVTAQLLEGGSGASVERASFVLPAANLLAVMDSAAQEVSRLLREWIGVEVRIRGLRGATSSNEAWALLQRGEKARKDAEGLVAHDDLAGAFQLYLRADSLLERAEAADEGWAEPSLLRGRIAYRLSRLSAGDVGEAVEFADIGLGHVERALQREPDDAAGLELRGTLRYSKHFLLRPTDPAGAEQLLGEAQQDLETAIATDPSLASAHSTISHLYYLVGQPVDVVLAAQRAYEADAYLTLADEILFRLYQGHYDLEQPMQAKRWCDEGHRRFPDGYRFEMCQLWLMTTSAVQPDVDEAWRLMHRVDSLVPDHERGFETHLARMVVGGVLALAGHPDSADAVLTAARAGRDIDDGLNLPYFEAYMRVLLGDHDEAINQLKRWLTAHPEQDHGVDEGEASWWWRDLRNHPRFPELLAGGR